MTYRGESSYSFCVCLSKECLLESDDCVVDISDDNVVLLLTKESKGLWQNFQVGLNPNQTEVSTAGTGFCRIFATGLTIESHRAQ